MAKRKGRLEASSEARELTVAGALLDSLEEMTRGAQILVVDDATDTVGQALSADGAVPTLWSRWCINGRLGSTWPEGGPYDGATLRLPKAKPALELALHAIASVLRPGAPIWIYGANDEGIRSADKIIESVFADNFTLETRRRCRIFEARRDDRPVKDTLRAWVRTERWAPPKQAERDWHVYPGIFAKGQLDVGTEALLSVLKPPFKGARILDYACGMGVVGAAQRAVGVPFELTMLDADAIAVDAARLNVPDAEVVLGDRLSVFGTRKFDRILSNPPFHAGKDEDFGVMRALVADAPRALKAYGELWMVVQRRAPVGPWLETAFKRVDVAHEDTRFKVWRAKR